MQSSGIAMLIIALALAVMAGPASAFTLSGECERRCTR
jgi:hypothetical protein